MHLQQRYPALARHAVHLRHDPCRYSGRAALTTAEKCRTWLNQRFRYAMIETGLLVNTATNLDIVAVPKKPVKHNPWLRMQALPELIKVLHAYWGAIQTKPAGSLIAQLAQANKLNPVTGCPLPDSPDTAFRATPSPPREWSRFMSSVKSFPTRAEHRILLQVSTTA